MTHGAVQPPDEKPEATMARAQKPKPIITDESIAKHPFTKEGEVIIRDNILTGFLCRIGKRSKTFSFRYERRKNGTRLPMKSVTLGQFGVDGYTAAQARIDAETAKGQGHSGTLPSKSGAKIADILPRYKQQTIKNHLKRDTTLLSYDNAMKRLQKHSPVVLACTLRELIEDQSVMEGAIESIVKECGQASANATIRFVRGITLFAKRDRKLALPPGHPCENVYILEPDETEDSLSPRELKTWWGHHALVTDPILKEQWMFTLLSGGIRKSEVQSLRWSDFDYAERKIRVWDPKGGGRLAFDCVLSRPAIRCLMRARAAGRRLYPKESKVWCFPGDVKKPSKWAGTNMIREPIIDVTSHTLRRTWAALAKSYCSVSGEDVDRMQNRSGKTIGDRRYIRSGPMGPHYMNIQERVSVFLLSKRPVA
jgi:integrase